MLKVDIHLNSPRLGKSSPRFQSTFISPSLKSSTALLEDPKWLDKIALVPPPKPSRGIARNSRSPGWVWLILPFFLTSAMVLMSPHTKVEETPALVAVKDILELGILPKDVLQSYEHVKYPGPVPRSMIPSLLLSVFISPLIPLVKALHLVDSDLDIQILIRLAQAAIFSIALAHLTTTIHRTFSQTAARFFVLLTSTQFHITYYAGRTLPNFLALPWVILAFSILLRSLSPQTADPENLPEPNRSSFEQETELLQIVIGILTAVATIVRLEIAPIAITTSIILIAYNRITITKTLISGAVGGFGGLCLTALIDGYFYSPLNYQFRYWPELSAGIFNVIQGTSAEWGIQPPWYYIICLLKIGTFTLPFIFINIFNTSVRQGANRERLALLLLPGLVQIITLSFVGHKEWRFIIYSIPLFNILAANTMADLWNSKSRRNILRICLISCIILNLFITVGKTSLSRLNYPGGEIGTLLEYLNFNHPTESLRKVWIPAAALHTGTTPFTLPDNGFNISRPEAGYERCTHPFGNSPGELWTEGYDWVVTDDWGIFESSTRPWEVVSEVNGYRGIKLSKNIPFFEINIGRRLAIMGRIE